MEGERSNPMFFGNWTVCSKNAVLCGAPAELVQRGMLQCSFRTARSPSGEAKMLIERLHITFDTLSWTQQLQKAFGAGSSFLPRTTSTLRPSTDAQVLCAAAPPHDILSTNDACQRLVGYTNEEALGKPLAWLGSITSTGAANQQGQPTDMNHVLSDARQGNCGHLWLSVTTKSGLQTRTYAQVTPLVSRIEAEGVPHGVEVDPVLLIVLLPIVEASDLRLLTQMQTVARAVVNRLQPPGVQTSSGPKSFCVQIAQLLNSVQALHEGESQEEVAVHRLWQSYALIEVEYRRFQQLPSQTEWPANLSMERASQDERQSVLSAYAIFKDFLLSAYSGSKLHFALFNLLKHTSSKAVAHVVEQFIWCSWSAHANPQVEELVENSKSAIAGRRYLEAVEHCTQALALDPRHAEAYNRRATAHFHLGKHTETLDDVQRCLEHEPKHFGAYCGQGLTWLALKRPSKAQEAFTVALEINPWMEVPRWHLSLCRTVNIAACT